jgi:FlaA1/EpsC-like NDP-sugar epimerase
MSYQHSKMTNQQVINNKNKQPLLGRPDFIPEFAQWEKFKDTVIGITGHRGVLGRNIFKRFCKAGINVEAYQGDILDVGSLTSWFGKRQFSHFFHFAAFVPVAETEKNPSMYSWPLQRLEEYMQIILILLILYTTTF